jgi:hypothetical protein
MFSKARACLRTSIFVRQSDARTNTRADLMASRSCILASPAQLVSRLMRAWQCKRRKRLIESLSSLSTSCSKVTCEVQAKRGFAHRRLSFKFGRSGSKIGRYSPLRGNRATAVAPIGGGAQCTVVRHNHGGLAPNRPHTLHDAAIFRARFW